MYGECLTIGDIKDLMEDQGNTVRNNTSMYMYMYIIFQITSGKK